MKPSDCKNSDPRNRKESFSNRNFFNASELSIENLRKENKLVGCQKVVFQGRIKPIKLKVLETSDYRKYDQRNRSNRCKVFVITCSCGSLERSAKNFRLKILKLVKNLCLKIEISQIGYVHWNFRTIIIPTHGTILMASQFTDSQTSLSFRLRRSRGNQACS